MKKAEICKTVFVSIRQGTAAILQAGTRMLLQVELWLKVRP